MWITLSYHRSTLSLKYHLMAKHTADAESSHSPRQRQTTLDSFQQRWTDSSTNKRLTTAIAKWVATACRPVNVVEDVGLLEIICIASNSSSSSSPLLSLVTSTSEISHQPVHTYTTYIWQRGRQNRKTGNVRKIQHLHEEREEEKKINPQTMLHWGVQCENRKKKTQHKSTYTINTWLATGGHIQLWQAAVRSSRHLLRRRSQVMQVIYWYSLLLCLFLRQGKVVSKKWRSECQWEIKTRL